MSDVPPGAMASRQKPNFLQFLARFQAGDLVDRLTLDLEELISKMEQLEQDHGVQISKGELQLTLKLGRKKGAYDIVAEIKTKAPKPPAPTEVMWANEHNSLVPENPRQQKFAFAEVVRPRPTPGSDA